jgi:hypothetical protein
MSDLSAQYQPRIPAHAPLTVIREGSSILELLSGEDQSLLVRGDTLLVLDLGFDVVDGVGRLHLEGDGLARKAEESVLFFLGLPALLS